MQIKPKQYHKNPRKITEVQLKTLVENIKTLGDLSGVVHDLNSDEIISGNQRSKGIDITACEIEIVHQLAAPDAQGTVALGFILYEGQRLNYRQVRWTPEQCERANVTANKLGGEFDYDILTSEFSEADLLQWGFEEWEMGTFAFTEPGTTKETTSVEI